MLSERIFSKNNIDVVHKFQAAKQDRQHLLVVFSGFGSKTRIIYDFTGNASIGCRSNILWIKDDFSQECAYYLCQNMSFDIEDAIITLINNTISDLSIKRDQVTLMGFSKGATASLYYGLKYDFKNIISSCPRVKIGSALKNQWPSVAQNVMGEINDSKVELLDNLIPDLLNSDKALDKNIYLVSSPRDELYKTELEPYLHYFWKYSNFNFVFTDSCLAWRHNKITRYNMPIILSIIYANGEGVNPRFGFIQNGISDYHHAQKHDVLKKQVGSSVLINDVSQITFKDNRLFLKGCAFIKGVECPQHKDIEQFFILKSADEELRFALGSVKNEELSYRYFDTVFSDYSCGGFSTIKHQGIDISKIKKGVYQLFVMVRSGGYEIYSELESGSNICISELIDGDEINIKACEDGIYISRRDFSEQCHNEFFEITLNKIIGSVLYLEGIYVVKGVHLREWNDAKYYLSLVSQDFKYSYKLGMLNDGKLNGLFQESSAYYQKSCFSTIGRKGIDICGVRDGLYSVFVSMAIDGSIYTKECVFGIKVKDKKFSLCQPTQ